MDQNQEREANLWCSWCFEQSDQIILEKRLFGRNLYRCHNCCNETNHCTMCSAGMSRNTLDGADKLCAKCDGTVEKWGIYPELHEEAHCSWCFDKTKHTLTKYNYVRRSVYECGSCKKRTLKCRLCQKAFVRGSLSYDSELCAVCDHTVDNWDNPDANRQKLTDVAWCSWCVTRTKHIKEDINTVRRSVYKCEECEGRSIPCVSCFPVAMARGAPGWDDDYCVCCEAPDKRTWGDFERRKNEIFAKYSPEYAKSELQRESEYHKKAIEKGMIRPFLLLVGMAPKVRNQVASFLGWSLITQPYFGDSHAESWEIISKKGSGIIARAESISSKLLSGSRKKTSYYEVLHQVIKELFHRAPTKILPHNEAFQASVHAADPNVLQLEEHLMAQVHSQQRKSMTREQRHDEDLMMESSNSAIKNVRETVYTKAKLHNQESMKYAMGIVKSALHTPNEWGLTIMSLQALQTALPATGAVVGPAVLGLSALMGPLALIGMFGMVTKGVTIALGPSLARLYGPLVLMIDQRILMAVQGLEVDTFY